MRRSEEASTRAGRQARRPTPSSEASRPFLVPIESVPASSLTSNCSKTKESPTAPNISIIKARGPNGYYCYHSRGKRDEDSREPLKGSFLPLLLLLCCSFSLLEASPIREPPKDTLSKLLGGLTQRAQNGALHLHGEQLKTAGSPGEASKWKTISSQGSESREFIQENNYARGRDKSQIDLGIEPSKLFKTNEVSAGRLLVSQLTSLIMNNDIRGQPLEPIDRPETNRLINSGDKLGDVRNQLSETVQRFEADVESMLKQEAEEERELEEEEREGERAVGIKEEEPEGSQITSRGSISEKGALSASGADLGGKPAALLLRGTEPHLDKFEVAPTDEGHLQPLPAASGDQSEAFVTCPPDYDDPSLVINEAAGSNLTAEQQQQLFADTSVLIGNSTMANESFKLPPHCYQSGFKMIEMITKVITPILFSIIIVVGLVGNIIVMLVILEDRKTERELTPTGLLILDLSLADLSFIIFCIPFTGWDYAVGHWVFGGLWCKFNQYLIVVCALSSIYTLVLMSVDRFIAIVYPIECISLRTSKNTLRAIYIKWILILIMASPTIPRHGLIDSPLGPDQYNCRFLADQYEPLYFQIAFFLSSYLFPLILIFVLYLSLLIKLWYGTKPHGHKESIKTLESKKKVTWLVAGIVVVFALCWCPIQVMLILMRLKSYKITATYVAIQVFSHTLGYMNSCVNPIVYAFASESFLNSFKRSSLGRFCFRCLCLNNTNSAHGHEHATDRSMVLSNRTTLMTTANYSLNNHSPQHRGSQQHTQMNHNNHHHRASFNTGNTNDDSNGNNGSLVKDTNLSTITICTTVNKGNNVNGKRGFNKIVSLPLEPRDRATPPPIVHNTTTLEQTASPATLERTPEEPVAASNQCASPSQQIPLNRDARTTKQQLVARVIQSSNQVSHCCEPIHQKGLVAP